MFLEGPYRKIEPASAAIVMAIGIFLIGTIEAFPLLNDHVGKLLACILLVIWVIIYGLLSIQFFHRDFLIPFIKHPVQSFSMGTWIAGVSVLCNVFLEYFPNIISITQMMALFNSLLWILFLGTCIYNFKRLLFEVHDYPVHGILLLSTVGTQSVIVLLNNVFFQLPTVFSKTIIIVGLGFYVIGMFLITIWNATKSKWTIAEDWPNTNCIIHGALSITGFAIVTTQTFSPFFVQLLWWLTVVLIIVVEGLEVLRGVKRIRWFGWKKGIFQYHVTQWSRNFTFGMFYVFTLLMHKDSAVQFSEPLHHIQGIVLRVWAWIVFIALLVEVVIFARHLILSKRIYNEGFSR